EINSSYENNRYESDDDEEEDEDVENNFYTAESLEEDENFIEAITEYKKILAQETSEKTEWGLKSLIKLLKISINQRNYSSFLAYYNHFLTYMKFANLSYIDSVLKLAPNSAEILKNLYEITDNFYKKNQDSYSKTTYLHRMKFKYLYLLAKFYFDMKEFEKTHEIVEEMKGLCGINSSHGFLWTRVF
uniref:KIF-binding protein n=1 Tax=Acrobeloides nanus TaxID=290746 RepID=A0A914D6S2_9BILA